MRTSVSRWSNVAVAMLAAASVVLGLSPAGAASSDEARLLALTNQVRAANGLSPLTINGQITGVAQRWAGVLAERGVLSHNSSLPSQVTGWKDLGENVGVGGTADAVHAGFLASPTHRANIVDPAFTQVGFGVVRPDARIFVVVVFMQPVSSPVPASPKAPATPATPAAATPVQSTVPPAPSPAATAVRATPPAQLSPWMVVSLEQLRSMQPTTPR